jgi:phage-related protein
MLNVIFFKTKAGHEPVLEWLREQDVENRKLIGADLRTVQIGWPLGMPLVRHLGDGIYEVRTDIRDGIARVLVFQNQQNLIVVEGFIKKSQKTPKTQLDNAKKRKSEYERNLREDAKREKKAKTLKSKK